MRGNGAMERNLAKGGALPAMVISIKESGPMDWRMGGENGLGPRGTSTRANGKMGNNMGTGNIYGLLAGRDVVVCFSVVVLFYFFCLESYGDATLHTHVLILNTLSVVQRSL